MSSNIWVARALGQKCTGCLCSRGQAEEGKIVQPVRLQGVPSHTSQAGHRLTISRHFSAPRCDVEPQLRFSLPSSSSGATLPRNRTGLAGHGGKICFTDRRHQLDLKTGGLREILISAEAIVSLRKFSSEFC